MELEAKKLTSAEKHKRTPTRMNYLNGYRERSWEARVGEINLRIPKLRVGIYFPSLLELRKHDEKALLAVT